MKTALMILVASIIALVGCTAPATPGFDESTVVSVAHYEGSFAETWQGCATGALLGGDCSAVGGTALDNRADGAKWYCKARPDNESGVTLTITTYCATDKSVSNHQ